MNPCPIFLLAALACGSHHEHRLRGMVIDASTGSPLDSVRVCSRQNGRSVLSEKSGVFTLDRDGFRGCTTGTETIRTVQTRSVRITFRGDERTLPLGKNQTVPILLSDLQGRIVDRAVYRQQSRMHFHLNGHSPGIYMIGIGRNAWKMLLDASHPPVLFRKSTDVVTVYRLPGCGGEDLLLFSRPGYLPRVLSSDNVGSVGQVALKRKRWISSDIHNHTLITDGRETLDSVLHYSFTVGNLGLVANSEHGGAFCLDTAGFEIITKPEEIGRAPHYPGSSYVPRWYTLERYSWPKLTGQRKKYPGKVILLGLEWNVPAHEHASVGFVNDAIQPEAVSRFEFQFDANDADTGLSPLGKRNRTHEDALSGISWLKANFPLDCYCFINHPSREAIGPYKINHFRDFHNLAPDICFAFEGMPGHHKAFNRGNYYYGTSGRNRTWGGADHVLASLGGIWDALLGEGRRFYTIVNSDFHNRTGEHWPGEYAKTWSVTSDTGARAWLDGMRTGQIFIAHGDLVSGLEFSVSDGSDTVFMGSELYTSRHELMIEILFRKSESNARGPVPEVDHIDLIAGAITGFKSPADTMPVNPSTRVLRRFSSRNWIGFGEWRLIRYPVSCRQPTYFRLRGTNHAVGTPGEVDSLGNPLMDPDGNSDANAWNDLWFYSNPLFVYPSQP